MLIAPKTENRFKYPLKNYNYSRLQRFVIDLREVFLCVTTLISLDNSELLSSLKRPTRLKSRSMDYIQWQDSS